MPPKQKDFKAECTKRGLDATGQRAADLPTSSVGNADEITPTPAPAKKGRNAASVATTDCDDTPRPAPTPTSGRSEEKATTVFAKPTPGSSITTAPGSAQAPASASTKTRICAKVDSNSPYTGTHKVYSDTVTTFDATLNQMNIGMNNGKFYVIQVLKHKTMNSYVTWTRWGRVSEVGANAVLFSGDSADAAVKAFEKKFQDKSGNKWSERDNFKKKPGKYDLIEMGNEEEEEEEEAVSKYDCLVLAIERGTEESDAKVLAMLDPEVVKERNSDFEQTLLHHAAYHGRVALLRPLVLCGADINAQTVTLYTALDHACMGSKRETALALAAMGADPTIPNNNGCALDTARGAWGDGVADEMKALWCEAMKHSMIVLLKVKGSALSPADVAADVAAHLMQYPEAIHELSHLGETPLHVALGMGADDAAQQLVEAGCPPSAVDKAGKSPLCLVVESGSTEMVLMLLRAGADVRWRAKDATSLLHIALKNNNADIATILVNNGVDMDDLDDNGMKHLIVELNVDIPFMRLEQRKYKLWTRILEHEGSEAMTTKAVELVSRYPQLRHAKDHKGRAALELASQDLKDKIVSLFCYYGRYEVTVTRPEHKSGTCFVFQARDRLDLDSNGNARPVAIKLMRFEAQYRREVDARVRGFDNQYVMPILRTHERSAGGDAPSAAFDGSDVLTKEVAESFWAVVMPLADRNLFVAIKQERFAGVDMHQCRLLCLQLVEAVAHMHSKGYIHGDIKPFNIVRIDGKVIFIDLDATAKIGIDSVGFKSSSAYVPPEGIFVDPVSGIVAIRSHQHQKQSGCSYDLLVAHPSFDVWALGCVFYQLCSGISLFKEMQDDNLSADINDPDSLWELAQWSDDVKTRKLAKISDPQARNLVTQMLMKDATQRPTIARVLDHPFLTRRTVTRMVGEEAEFDVFLSYRVASDSMHAEQLYNILTAAGLKVWWDKKCLKPGENWKEGFCNGLFNSHTFVCLLSRGAINHPTNERQSFAALKESSQCDNVFLEHRLAMELKGLGLVEKIFPVMIGDWDESSSAFRSFSPTGCFPKCPDVVIMAVEADVRQHMSAQGLGSPLIEHPTVAATLGQITMCQGAFIEGSRDAAFEAAVNAITVMATKPSTISTSMEIERCSHALDDSVGDEVTMLKTHISMQGLTIKSQHEEIVALKDLIRKLRAQAENSRDPSAP